jgi:subtilisin family serine protease
MHYPKTDRAVFLANVFNFLVFLVVFLPFQAAASEIEVVSGRYLVSFQPMFAAGGEISNQLSDNVAATAKEIAPGISLIELKINSAKSTQDSEPIVEAYDLVKHQDACQLLSASNPHLTRCEPEFVYRSLAWPSNDTLAQNQWGIPLTNIPAAWSITSGSSDVVVAVIDTGVDYNHPDLAQNMWTDPDGGYGYNFFNNNPNPMDFNSHGTHVAGTIAALRDNAIGVAGVAPEVRIMAIQFLGANGAGTLSGAINSIYYAINNGANVINASWGGGGNSSLLKEAIAAAGDAGILFVAAAGNNATDNQVRPTYPASFDLPNIISVAANNVQDSLAWFSNYGASAVDIAAPGVGILSSVPGGYSYYSGTSMAAPHVAGVAALILSNAPELKPWEVKGKILGGADLRVSLLGKVRSGARLNALGALLAAPGDLPQLEDPTEPVAITNFTGRIRRIGHNRHRVLAGKRFRVDLRGSANATVNLTVHLSGRETFSCDLGMIKLDHKGQANLRANYNPPLRLSHQLNKITVSVDNIGSSAAKARRTGFVSDDQRKRARRLGRQAKRQKLELSYLSDLTCERMRQTLR